MRVDLFSSLLTREVSSRYKGTALGVIWSVLTPLFMLGVYAFVFGSVFQARWSNDAGDPAQQFAVILFCGLIIFQVFSEFILVAPTIILSNQNYVKKVVFPLEILVPVVLGGVVFQLLVNMFILMIFVFVTQGELHVTALLLPIVLAPYLILILGLGYLLSSIGAYLRDINQVLAPIVTACMFLAPLFFPASALPEIAQRFVKLNPVTIPIVQTREVVVFGSLPNPIDLLAYTIVALVVFVIGRYCFSRTRKGFADVL